ncbi:MAG: bifunctional adenosylcobinamide kinase/adenosylcobinamide-phosphate guanylyltransferase [Fusobacteriaceae bacterium]
MGEIIYITGGARSGKSTYGENYIRVARGEREKVYIATAYVYDDEMKIRVEKHREQRGEGWQTVEKYKNLSEEIDKTMGDKKIILLDCVTNLVTNFMLENLEIEWGKIGKERLQEMEIAIMEELKRLVQYIRRQGHVLVLVSNEVGMGIVPDNPLARHFRDIAGRVNQYCAEEADEAYLIVSGLKVKLK